MTDDEIFDCGPELEIEIMRLMERHLMLGTMPEDAKRAAAANAAFELLVAFRDHSVSEA